MKPIKDIVAKYKNTNAASLDLGINSVQLTRWINMGALVDTDGQIWIKTKGNLYEKQS